MWKQIELCDCKEKKEWSFVTLAGRNKWKCTTFRLPEDVEVE
jgi:hypothetical protein